jgi:putative redox protein
MKIVTANAHLVSGYQVEARARDHRWTSDVPELAGGTDLGPTPEEMLLGALGACTAQTLRMYAKRKGWPLEDVRVDLSYATDVIERRVDLVGPLDAEQSTRLLEIANKCPVHRILTKPASVVTSLVDSLERS